MDAYTHHVITSNLDGTYHVRTSTNDDLDTGGPSEFAQWDSNYISLEKALKATGRSRTGIQCEVVVTVDGVVI